MDPEDLSTLRVRYRVVAKRPSSVVRSCRQALEVGGNDPSFLLGKAHVVGNRTPQQGNRPECGNAVLH